MLNGIVPKMHQSPGNGLYMDLYDKTGQTKPFPTILNDQYFGGSLHLYSYTNLAGLFLKIRRSSILQGYLSS